MAAEAGTEMDNAPLDSKEALASASGNIADRIDASKVAQIGADVVEDYDRDVQDRKEWADKAEAAVKAAAQEKAEQKDHPWPNASNVKYPILTVASLQFNARAYPAIVKGDEAVSIKIIGRDSGRPAMQIVNGVPQPVMAPMAGPDGMIAAGPDGQPQMQPVWLVPPGAKKQRADRVKDYLNTYLFYRMPNWEQDTDQLLLMLPIVGCMFRKVYKKGGEFKVCLVSGLKLVAPMWAKDCEHSPRLTEVIDDLATYQVNQRMASGYYREVKWPEQDGDEEKPRLLLEQHRYMDLDEDGISEPYIITVDHETKQVLRLEPNFGPDQLRDDDGDIDKASVYYIKYDFFPNPDGCFYGIGFGHLLSEITEVVNTAINQLIDAGTAQIAGGGFIASGLRMQAKGQTSIRFRPGEYKTVDSTADQLRNGIYERTYPQPSPIAFQLLELMLGAAKDISSVEDVLTGDASNQGQVGTTLALIEQGLQVFTAIYKRVYRSLKAEFTLLFESMAKWGGEVLAQDYIDVLDDPMADFAADFTLKDMDIRPVSDPTSVTKMQKMGRAQFMLGFLGKGLNDIEIMRNALEAADVEDVEKYLPKGPPQPDPLMVAEVNKKTAEATDKMAQARQREMETAGMAFEHGVRMGDAEGAAAGNMSGAANGTDTGGLPGMEGAPGNAMGAESMPLGS